MEGGINQNKIKKYQKTFCYLKNKVYLCQIKNQKNTYMNNTFHIQPKYPLLINVNGGG